MNGYLRTIGIGVALFVAIQFATVYLSPDTHALSGRGYFTGRTGSWSSGYGGDVLPGRPGSNAVPNSAKSKSGFISFIKGRLSGGNAQAKTGAAFIINMMVGAGKPGQPGKDRTPSRAMINDWEERINQSRVTIDIVYADPNNYGSITFYDPSINDDFGTSYNSGSRELIVFRVDGEAQSVVEVPCGNPVLRATYLPPVKKWGPMTATTIVNKSEAAPGESVRWTHNVWNTGTVGNDRSDSITGSAYWGDATTGPGIDAYKRGDDSVKNPDKDFGRGFDKGKANGWEANYSFTIPDNAQNNDKYCQYAKGSPTSSSDNSTFRSTGVCVKVVADRPTGNIAIRCVNSNTGLQRITYNFKDNDSNRSNPVVARIVWGSKTVNISNASGAKTVSGTLTDPATNLKTVIDKRGGTTYKLNVKDVGSGGGSYTTVDTVVSERCGSGQTVTSSIDPDTYSFYSSLTGTGTVSSIVDVDTQPKSGNKFPRQPRWDVYEVAFNRDPTAVNLSNNPDEDGCRYVLSQMGAYGPAATVPCELKHSDLYKKDDGSTVEKDVTTTNQKDPIGTWRCIITRIDTTPWISERLDRNWPEDEYETVNGRRVLVKDWPDRPADPGRNFRYSIFACSVSGLDPKVQVLSHDVRVGGNISTSLRDMRGGPQIGMNFGSVGEYGVESDGDNTHMSSGSGLNRGSGARTQSSWSALTFANIPSGDFGGYGRSVSIGDLDSNIAGSVTGTLPGPDVYAANIDMSPGAKNVYRFDGDITIRQNILLPLNYGSTLDVPRAVIMADSISINPGVTQIDAWLVAAGDTANGQGYINTCGTAATRPLPFTNGVQLTYKGGCQNQLVFNAPVYTKKLYLYRTGGSGIDATGNDNPDDAMTLARPAEIFNLRPDNFLSSYTGGGLVKPVARTDRVTELPPRF